MSVSYTEEPRRRRDRIANGGSRRAQQEQPDLLYSPQPSNEYRQRRRHQLSYDHWPETTGQQDSTELHARAGGQMQMPVPMTGPALSDNHHLHNPDVGEFSVDPNAPILGMATSEEAQIFDAEHPNIGRPSGLNRTVSTKKVVGGIVKGVRGIGHIPKAMMDNYNEGYERRMARPRPAVRIPVQTAAVPQPAAIPPPMQIPRSTRDHGHSPPHSDFSHAVYPTSSGHGDTTLVNHDPPSFIPPSTPHDKYNTKEGNEKYPENSQRQGISFKRFLSRISQFIHNVNELPWIAPGRVTVDYVPAYGKRSRAASESTTLRPQVQGIRYYPESTQATPPLRQTLSWYNNLHDITVTLNPQDVQSVTYVSPNQQSHLPSNPNSPANGSSPMQVQTAAFSSASVPRGMHQTPQYPNGYVPTQPTNLGAGIFSGMADSSHGHEPTSPQTVHVRH